jgi:colicin import membrane protein
LFGIGGFEFFLILLFAFLIFGPDKLPAIAKTVAQALNKFKSAQEEMNKVIKSEVYDPTSDEPFKNPLEVLAKVGDKVSEVVAPKETTESFSERKAKYDKERAEKRATEEAAAKTAEKAATATVRAASVATAAASTSGAASKMGAKPASAAKPKVSAEELYGNKSATPTKPKATTPAASIAASADKPAKPAAKPAKPAAKPASEKKGE